jgi:hypothetical protein
MRGPYIYNVLLQRFCVEMQGPSEGTVLPRCLEME